MSAAEAKTTKSKIDEGPTLGPWWADEFYVYAGSDCIGMCDTDNGSDARYAANALLMAAAPDLLEMAKLFERCVEYEIRRSRKDGDEEGARLKTVTLNLIRNAIAKAEGRAP